MTENAQVENLEDDSTGGIEETPGISAEDAVSLAAGDIPPATEPKKDGVQKRIDELTRATREAEREAAYWKGVAATSKPTPAGGGGGKAVVDGPDRDDFIDDADYIRAVAEHERKKIREVALAEANRQADQNRQQAFAAQIKTAKEKYSDFDAVALTQGTHTVTQEMLSAAMGDKLGDILYYLGSNRDESNRIATLPYAQQMKEIGKIEARLTASKPKPKTTQTPNPPTTLKGGGADGNKSKKSESEMSYEERKKKWEEERLKGR